MWLYRAPCRAAVLSVDQAVEQKRVQELLRLVNLRLHKQLAVYLLKSGLVT